MIHLLNNHMVYAAGKTWGMGMKILNYPLKDFPLVSDEEERMKMDK